MIRTVVIGAAGRMGQALVKQVLESDALQLAGAVDVKDCPAVGQDAAQVAGLSACGIPITADLAAALADADAVIDFSAREATCANAATAVKADCAVVIGTTGLDEAERDTLAQLTDRGGRIVFAPNMSVGVNLLFHLCDEVTRILGPDYDIEVVEMHHNRKKDAPSGTAERLGEILAAARGLDYKADARHGRVGHVGARTRNEIGLHALRGGDVVGDHTVIFAAEGERVELTHKASSRDTFAKGAVRAVAFLADATPGLYDMQDVLGIKKDRG